MVTKCENASTITKIYRCPSEGPFIGPFVSIIIISLKCVFVEARCSVFALLWLFANILFV